MLFNSLPFLIFLPVVITLYYLLPHNLRWVLLFVASCFFYMMLVPAYILILFFLIVVDYSSGIFIERSEGRKRKIFLVISIIANIGLLGFFKYYNFFFENISHVLHFFGREKPIEHLNIILPIGLSFHTFQSLSYIIEVYRGKQKAEYHLGYYANYVLFFPQMVAGPIERYERLGIQLREKYAVRFSISEISYADFANGFRLILYGFFVKMVIADNLAPIVNMVYDEPSKLNSVSIITGILFFSFQIYADFYGYSLIALGSARLMGINLMNNFNTPYFARSIGEFWQRWHISLSTWFRDYLYIPLGGNKVKTIRWCINIIFVFVISGLWHGANYTFIIWGLLHGALYLLEHAASRFIKIKKRDGFSLLNIFFILKNFLLVTFIWIFFRSENMAKAKEIISSAFKNIYLKENEFNVPATTWILFISFIIIEIFLYNKRIDVLLGNMKPLSRWLVYAILIFCVMAMSGTVNYPFIYFQF